MNYKNQMVTISAGEYHRLLKREFEFQYLEYAGVDNWVWYGSHLEILKEKYPDLEDTSEMLDIEAAEYVQAVIDHMNEVK